MNSQAGEPETRPRRGSQRGGKSPDGKWSLFVREHNLFLKEEETGEETKLSNDGKAGDAYRERVWWSPDSRYVAAIQVLEPPAREVTLVESSPRDQLQPKTISFEYRKPGDEIPHPRPRLFDVQERKAITHLGRADTESVEY